MVKPSCPLVVKRENLQRKNSVRKTGKRIKTCSSIPSNEVQFCNNFLGSSVVMWQNSILLFQIWLMMWPSRDFMLWHCVQTHWNRWKCKAKSACVLSALCMFVSKKLLRMCSQGGKNAEQSLRVCVCVFHVCSCVTCVLQIPSSHQSLWNSEPWSCCSRDQQLLLWLEGSGMPGLTNRHS